MGENTRDKIIRVSREIELMTGQTPYLYTSTPGDGQVRVVFQGKVCHGRAAGLAYIEGLRADAYREYADRSGPFDKESTDYVSQWIANDGDHYPRAVELSEGKDLDGLREYLTEALNSARKDSAAWYTRRELSDGDMGRIEWLEVAKDLTDL